MIDRSDTGLTVILHGADRSTWHVHGQGKGAEGAWCAKDQMKGLFDPPVRSAWASGARQRGGRPKGHWYDPRDLEFGFHLIAARIPGGDQETLMGRFRDVFTYEEDQYDWDSQLPRVQIITPKGHEIWLDVQKHEHNKFDPGIDPLIRGHANPTLQLRAGQPFYYQEPEVTKWSTGASSDSGFITVSNPSPLPMFQKWRLTRGDWLVPDVSIEGQPWHRFLGRSKRTGRDDSERAILMPPITALHGGGVVDLDPDELMVADAHGTNLLGQMPVPGMYFTYEIPPKTQELQLPISVTNAPAGGAMAQLVQPRLWPEPVGVQ